MGGPFVDYALFKMPETNLPVQQQYAQRTVKKRKSPDLSGLSG